MAYFYPQIIDWEAEFPGTSLTIKTLRDSAIFAHKIATTTRTYFQQLQGILDYIGDPMSTWHPKLIRFYRKLQREQLGDTREFKFQLRALKEAFKWQTPSTAKPFPQRTRFDTAAAPTP